MITMNKTWEAAERYGFRGYFYFPTLDAQLQLPEYSRQAISEKINWLYNNVGFIRAVVDGLSLDEVSTGIWPKASTSSREFNRAATDRYHETWKDARFFDTRKVENVYSAQLLIRRHIRLHGELFAQLVRPDENNASARLHFIPAYQVANLQKEAADSKYLDGIQLDEMGAAKNYRVITDKTAQTYKRVPAEDMLHFHDAFWCGQTRGTSALAAMARKLFTLDDIERMTANGIQLRSMVAYAIERTTDDTGGPTLLPNVIDTEVVNNEDGTQTKVQKITSEDGLDTTVLEPPAGRSIKVVESNAANEPFKFKEDVLRDLAHCTGYPPEYVFSLAGMAQGTLVRLTMQRVKTLKDYVRQNQIIPQFLDHAYRFRTWQDINTGYYDRVGVTVPEDWYKVKFICPADTTVDIGREGALYDERVSTGKMSVETYFGLAGEDRADVDAENLRVREERDDALDALNRRRALKGQVLLAFEDIWPANTQAAANAAAQPVVELPIPSPLA